MLNGLYAFMPSFALKNIPFWKSVLLLKKEPAHSREAAADVLNPFQGAEEASTERSGPYTRWTQSLDRSLRSVAAIRRRRAFVAEVQSTRFAKFRLQLYVLLVQRPKWELGHVLSDDDSKYDFNASSFCVIKLALDLRVNFTLSSADTAS